MMTSSHQRHYTVMNYFLCFPLHAKSNTFATLQKLLPFVKTQFSIVVCVVQIDICNEFVNNAPKTFFIPIGVHLRSHARILHLKMAKRNTRFAQSMTQCTHFFKQICLLPFRLKLLTLLSMS
jgi:hypothetical protein